MNIENYLFSILDLFENVLYENNMYIPDEFREGNEEEACIYGETYYRLEDQITDILKSNTKIIISPLIFRNRS